MAGEALAWFGFAVLTAAGLRCGWSVGTWIAERAYGDDRCPKCGLSLPPEDET